MANYNTQLSLPKLQLRGGDRMQKLIWDARLKDKLTDLGHPNFFSEPPPQIHHATLNNTDRLQP